jgi:cytochrome P450
MSAVAPDDSGLFSPEFLSDPYPIYTQLRAHGVFQTSFGFWLASRHEDVALLVRDRRFGKDFEANNVRKYGYQIMNEPSLRSLGRMMLVLDPPDHTRLIGLVNKAFTTNRIKALRPRIEAIANELIDQVIERGEMDVISDFAHKLPVHVICDMLGIVLNERARFLNARSVSGRLIDSPPMSADEIQDENARTERTHAYFKALFERRQETPTDDLNTHLVQAEEAGDRLDEQALVSNVSLLFAAGHETTTNLIGNGLLALHRNAEQWEKFHSDQVHWPDVVEELLRYDSSVQLTSRTAKEDVELGGATIPRGHMVIGLLGSANRDPAAYDDPDTLDVGRTGIRAMSFGGGIHTCLGARLARLEREVAFFTLVRRLPNMQLHEIDSPQWRQTYTLRGLEELRASW